MNAKSVIFRSQRAGVFGLVLAAALALLACGGSGEPGFDVVAPPDASADPLDDLAVNAAPGEGAMPPGDPMSADPFEPEASAASVSVEP